MMSMKVRGGRLLAVPAVRDFLAQGQATGILAEM